MVNLHPLIILDINTYKIIRTIDDHLHSNNNDNNDVVILAVMWVSEFHKPSPSCQHFYRLYG